MHVFLEGVLAYELKYLLRQYYIEEESTFSLQDLNQEIQTFPYGYPHIKDKRFIIIGNRPGSTKFQ